MAVTRGRAWNVDKAAGHLTGIKPRSGTKPRWERWRSAVAYLQAVAVFAAFIIFPIALIVVVSFWDYTKYVTLVLGFTVAYFLTFHVRTLKWRMTLFRAAFAGTIR
jgi:hypothetical protein